MAAAPAPTPTKSPYPCFTYPSIKTRCDDDLRQFSDLYKFDVSEYSLPGFESGSFVPAATLAELQSRMKSITDKIVAISEKKSMAEFNYPHQIRGYEPTVQNKLWCLRTLLFYQLLMTATEMMSNKELFDAVYADLTSNTMTPKREFRDDIVAELKNYKLGIFGSITTSSDIDLGVQFSGFDTLVGLAYIVSVFEDLFLIFTGKNSLEFDIETYADLVTIPDIRDKSQLDPASHDCSNVRDVFPFDTSKLTYDDFKAILPLVFAGALRNFVIAKREFTPDALVEEMVNSFDFQDFLKVTAEQTGTDFLAFLSEHTTVAPETINADLLAAFEKAKVIAIGYMSSSYADARKKYYEFVQTAEQSILKMKEKYFDTGLVDISNEELVAILMNASNALVYREESYTFFSTVMHIVRVMQANKDKNPDKYKYKTADPSYCLENKLTDAICAIGKYGYLISLFEQLGYIYRFHMTYCQQSAHYDAAKCSAKIKKYADRFKNGVQMVLELQQPIQPLQQPIQPLQQPIQPTLIASTAGGSRKKIKSSVMKRKAKKTAKRKATKTAKRKATKRKATKRSTK